MSNIKLKKIWFVSPDWELQEGYINSYYWWKDQEDMCDYPHNYEIYEEDGNRRVGCVISEENIFDNESTARHMYKGMLDIAIKQKRKLIEQLENEVEDLVNKKLSC